MDKQKKQTVIVGALFAVMLGVGAFQFLGGSAPAKAKPKVEASKDATATDGTAKPEDKKSEIAPEIAALIRDEYAVRDPFEPPMGWGDKPETTSPPTGAPSNEPKTTGLKAATTVRPKANPTVDPLPGVAPMPVSGIAAGGATNSSNSGESVSVKPGSILRQPGEPKISTVGIVRGQTPVAIVRDDHGRQHLLKVGSSVNGARLLKVSKRQIIVEFEGKTHALAIEEPNESKPATAEK